MIMEKVYEPKKYEDGIYKKWEKSGYFNPDKIAGKKKGVFSIVMPPPNVTGVLHVGHAVMLALEDILTRFYRMRGYDSLWLPGTDHAAIATQTKVEKILKAEGKTRDELGRKKFLAEVLKFAESSKKTIHKQVRKMGCSCDWSREAYTLDKDRTVAVRTMFAKMYEDGLIYRGYRIVNWCPNCASTLADDEVEYKEQEAMLYTFKYSKDFPFAIATTRPETKVGDTAVAVNPDDERYKKYIGETFEVIFAGKKLNILVIADKSIDKDFGTGALGVTPAHSIADWEMAQKNNLETIKVIDENGKMTSNAGNIFSLPVLEAREKIVEDLKKKGLLEKEEKIMNNLSVCYRCGGAVEPLPSEQWFVNVNKKIKIPGNRFFQNNSLKEAALEAVKSGEIKIMPERFEKVYYHWMENLRDWCISRQIWFGHQIPVWKKDGKTYVGVKEPKGKGWEQDSDTLDTWFSSGLWTFSTLGWPKKTKDLKKYHPTTVLETGYDILFFWIARMILMSTYATGDVPFKNVYLHGLVRDEEGKKMSKSLGNAIDPLEVSEKYGTDAVRLSLVMGSAPGNDVKLSEEKIAGFRNFGNKLWNISRFITLQEMTAETKAKPEKTLADKWILSKFAKLTAEVTADLEKYNFSSAAEKLRDFTWGEFADWYLEISKIESVSGKPLNEILESLLALWHPFIPFVTEAIWGTMLKKKNLIIEKYPESDAKQIDEQAEKDFAKIQEVIVKIRNLRAENRMNIQKQISALIISKDKLFSEQAHLIKGLAKIENLEIKESGEKPEGFAGSSVAGAGVYVDLSGGIDAILEKERLERELKNKENFLKSLDAKLLNSEFIARAPKNVVEVERAKKEKVLGDIKNLKEQLK